MVVNDHKQKLVEYRKKYYKPRKTPCYNCKRLFLFGKFGFFGQAWEFFLGIRQGE